MNAAPRAPDDFLVPPAPKARAAERRGRGAFPRLATLPSASEDADTCRLEILIVENDALVAAMLKDMIETEPVYRVCNIANDLDETLAAIAAHRPGLALVDLHLSGNATGIEVAARTLEAGITTLFSTANPLPFPVPELAVGCLCKPYTAYTVTQALRIVEQIIAGEVVVQDCPIEFEIY